MIMPSSRIYAEINLDHISDNFDKMHENLKPGTLMMAVIKANGYGHGAVEIGRMLEEKSYIWGYAVATAEEGLELRQAGLKKPILTLGYIFPEMYPAMIENDIRGCLFSEEMALEFDRAAAWCGKKGHGHIALDTGMSRIGFSDSEESAEAVLRISKLQHTEIEGLFTHFARADEANPEPTGLQLRRFLAFRDRLEAKGLHIPLLHVSNSAGILKFPEANLSMVRAGITLYGLDPSGEVPCRILGLQSAMSLISHVSYVKTVPAHTPISYGGTYVTETEERIATIPAGYADGYPRLLSNKGFVLIRGQRAPIRGRICMDQFMVDVTNIPDVSHGDEVVLLGKQGNERLTAEELGQLSGRFNYELVCDINKRVPRVYIRHGRMQEPVDCSNEKC